MINISYKDEGNGYLQTDLQISINLICFIHTLFMFLEAAYQTMRVINWPREIAYCGCANEKRLHFLFFDTVELELAR